MGSAAVAATMVTERLEGDRLAWERLEEECRGRGVPIRIRDGFPCFYIWMDLENNELNVSLDAQTEHIVEFVDVFFLADKIAV